MPWPSSQAESSFFVKILHGLLTHPQDSLLLFRPHHTPPDLITPRLFPNMALSSGHTDSPQISRLSPPPSCLRAFAQFVSILPSPGSLLRHLFFCELSVTLSQVNSSWQVFSLSTCPYLFFTESVTTALN